MLYRPSHRALREQTQTAERAPEASPAGGGWSGWSGAGTDPSACPCTSAQPPTHPAGPVGPPRPSLVGGWAPRAKGRHLSTFPGNLVKTAKCHRNMCKRPVIVPIFQNAVQKSPLGILRFTFLAAFSHKELMGHFRPRVILYCQNDEVSPGVHVSVIGVRDAKCAPDTPTVMRSKLLLHDRSSSGLARYSQRSRLPLETRHI